MEAMKVFIIAAITADGFIGRDATHLANWTSKEDKQLFVKLTKEAGTMVMGARTFDTIGRALPGRRTIVYTTHPEKYRDLGVDRTNRDPKELVAQVEKERGKALAVCGGAQVYDLFLQSGVVTDLYLTIEPILFGTGIPLFKTAIEQTLKLEELKQLNEHTVLVHYKLGSRHAQS